jgi:hypothetical protein
VWKAVSLVRHQTPKLGGHAFDWWKMFCKSQDSRLEEGSVINDNSKKKGVKLQVCGVINHLVQKPVTFEETRTKTSFAFPPKIKKGGRHVCVLVAKYCFSAL